MFGAVVRETPSTLMWPLSVRATPASSRPMPAVLGMEPDADQAVAAGDLGAVAQGDHHAVVGPFHGLGAGAGQHADAAAFEDFLQHLRGVGVRTGKHPVAAGDQGDLGAQAVVGGGKFGTGHAGPHHDEFLGKLVEVVDLRPVQDAFPVRPGGRQFARVRTHGQQDGVRLDGFRAVRGQDFDGVVVHELARAQQDADVLVFQAGRDVPGLLAGEAQQAVVDVLEVRAHDRHEVAAVDVELHSQLPRLADAGHQVRRRDQGLGRHDVGQHGRAAQAGAFDDGDLRPQRGSDHGGFVSARATSEDCDPG